MEFCLKMTLLESDVWVGVVGRSKFTMKEPVGVSRIGKISNCRPPCFALLITCPSNVYTCPGGITNELSNCNDVSMFEYRNAGEFE